MDLPERLLAKAFSIDVRPEACCATRLRLAATPGHVLGVELCQVLCFITSCKDAGANDYVRANLMEGFRSVNTRISSTIASKRVTTIQNTSKEAILAFDLALRHLFDKADRSLPPPIHKEQVPESCSLRAPCKRICCCLGPT